MIFLIHRNYMVGTLRIILYASRYTYNMLCDGIPCNFVYYTYVLQL